MLVHPSLMPHTVASTGQSHKGQITSGVLVLPWSAQWPQRTNRLLIRLCLCCKENFVHGSQEWASYLRVRETVFSTTHLRNDGCGVVTLEHR